jgi:uncharacterized membrane protein
MAVILASALIGMAGGVLSWLAGVSVPAALLTGGAAFGGAILLMMTIARSLDDTHTG